MRRLYWQMMLALLLGAIPASAQDGASLEPRVQANPVAAEPATKPAVHRAAKPAAKPAEKTAAVPPTPAKAPAPKAAQLPAPPQIAAAQTEPAKSAAIQPATGAPEKTKTEPDVFAGIPPAERLKIQSALFWSGDYPGAANSAEPLQTAIRNFQKRSKSKITGVLTLKERSDLVAAADAHEKEFGWSVVIDPATGIRIGLPTKLVPNARDATHGTRWSAAHGEVQVETFRFKDPNLKLSALFDQEKKQPATRKVETSALHDDSFFLSGMQGLKRFAVRAQVRNGEIRGFTMLFDQMMETIVAPVMVAMASAFSPFPEQHSMPFAALAKRVEYGTGVVVSAQGHIVTDRNLAHGCQVIVAPALGDAERVAEDEKNGLALLRVYGAHKLSPVPFGRETPSATDLTLVGIPDPKEQNGNHKRTEIKARLAAANAIELRQPVPMAGFSGAAALDGQGRFLGMMEMRNAVLASIDASAPPVRLITAKTIRDFLAANDVTGSVAPNADAKASVVRVICVRK